MQRLFPAVGFRYRRSLVLIVQPVDHIRGGRRKLLESATDDRMDDTGLFKANDVSRRKRNPPSLIIRIHGAFQPTTEFLSLVDGVPFGERANERERLGPGVQHMEDLNLVVPMLLKA